MNDLEKLRIEKNTFFARHPHSPLTKAQKKIFTALDYFPENPALRFELDLELFPQAEQVEIQTSSGDVQQYQRVGRIQFIVDGHKSQLTIFASHHGYFLPFVDALAGIETYPAGRYLEPEPLSDGRFLVDFNLAYNPYCAYNENWSCPLTPFENRLSVPIRAGEKIFKIQDLV